MSFLDDPNFQDELLVLAVHDRSFLSQNFAILSIDDFAPVTKGAPLERWYVAGIALDFWKKYRQPVGRYLRIEVIRFIKDRMLHEKAATALKEYATKISRMGRKPVALKAVESALIGFKAEKRKFDAVYQLMDHMRAGDLTDDVWVQIMRSAVDTSTLRTEVRDYFSGLEDRIMRRQQKYGFREFPPLLIDEFDSTVRSISFGHMGLIMAPFGRGKGLFFCWLDVIYAVQGLNVIHITLEDRPDDVEDRLDSIVTRVPLRELLEKQNLVRNRYANFESLVKSNVMIIDGTEGGYTMQRIESEVEALRDSGFRPDVVLIDYDDEIAPMSEKEKRYESLDEIYRSFRGMIARLNVIGWIASQTGRGTEEMKIIRGSRVAGAMEKIRKATLAISLGLGEWGPDSIFLWVEKHRLDEAHFGFNIVKNAPAMVFYDRQRTLDMKREMEIEKTFEGAENDLPLQ